MVASDEHTLSVLAQHAGLRVDHFVRSAWPQLSRAALRALFARGAVRVNGKVSAKGVTLVPGDRVDVVQTALGLAEGAGPAADVDAARVLSIVYEDPWLIAVDKPAPMPSAALRSGERGTLVSALLARFPELQGVGYRELEPGLLHRLDTETSGILLAARDQGTFERLREIHVAGGFEKRYLALVRGWPELGRVVGYLRADKRKVAVRAESFPGAKRIEAQITAVERFGGVASSGGTPGQAFALVEVRLALAGRHQVRAQLAQLGHPIAGDKLYGGPELPG
jgi:23S rRNA pseudouridine1911/1915/1917 synthase